MEPLVRVITCPHCEEAGIAFLNAARSACEGCGFEAAVYCDPAVAERDHRAHGSDPDVIVTDPVEFERNRWIIAHTRLLLV